MKNKNSNLACHCSDGKRAAFTLAEIIITLTILGI